MTLLSLQTYERFHPLGLREHIEGLYGYDGIIPILSSRRIVRILFQLVPLLDERTRENADVARHRGGVAGDHRDARNARLEQRAQGRAVDPLARRVDDQKGLLRDQPVQYLGSLSSTRPRC